MLTSAQIGWLGALLLAAQLPQAPHLPIWVAATGILLVGRAHWSCSAATASGRRRRRRASRRGRSCCSRWPRRSPCAQSFGYLSGRDPSVAFLYILVAIKFLETRTHARRHAARLPACFLLITPFFYSQSLLAALAVLPAVVLVGATLDALTNGRSAARGHAARRRMRRSGVMIAAGRAGRRSCCSCCSRASPRRCGDCRRTTSAQTGLSDSMAPGQISELSLSDDVAFRVDFDGPVPPARERYWRGPVLSRFDGRTWTVGQPAMRRRCRAPSDEARDHLHGHAGALLSALAVRARPAGGAAARSTADAAPATRSRDASPATSSCCRARR